MSNSPEQDRFATVRSTLHISTRSRWLVRALWRGLLGCAVFVLGVVAAQAFTPPPADSVILRSPGKPDMFVPVHSKSLTVVLQPLVPSAAVEAQLAQRHSDAADTARTLVGPEGLAQLAANLEQQAKLHYVVADAPLTLPDSAYDADRQQYSTELLLRWLPGQAQPGAFRTLGLTYADVYDKGFNYLFGEARIAGPVCVASSARMGGPVPLAQLSPTQRWHTIVRHELGHTLGLQHSPDPASAMHYGDSLEALDRQGTSYTSADWKVIKQLQPIHWDK